MLPVVGTALQSPVIAHYIPAKSSDTSVVGMGADIMERSWRRYGAGWHVYISVARTIDTVPAEVQSGAGLGLCACLDTTAHL